MNAREPLSRPDAQKLTFAVTLLSLGTAAVLAALKVVGWWRGGSVALLASFVDSGLDVIAALASFIAVRVAAAPPDEEHRFGHGTAEAFASLLQGGLVFASAALVGQQAVDRLLRPAAVTDEVDGLFVMTLSLACTLGLVFLQSWILSRVRSVAVAGDRAHYMADLASNLAAMAGLALAAVTRQPRWDAAAGLVVALWLLWGAVKVFRESRDHLMDRELDDADRQSIVDCVLTDPQVLGVHDLRTRASGASVHVQMHVDLDPRLTLVEAHRIVVAAEQRLMQQFPTADLIIHPDPAGLAEPVGPFGEEAPSGALQSPGVRGGGAPGGPGVHGTPPGAKEGVGPSSSGRTGLEALKAPSR
jgi:cation diffusion facilitator family transporter